MKHLFLFLITVVKYCGQYCVSVHDTMLSVYFIRYLQPLSPQSFISLHPSKDAGFRIRSKSTTMEYMCACKERYEKDISTS